MMRLRRASLLVAFYLLTSAATAHAECAWVLWSETTTYKPPRDVAWRIGQRDSDGISMPGCLDQAA
jgi:hypothetical protein